MKDVLSIQLKLRSVAISLLTLTLLLVVSTRADGVTPIQELPLPIAMLKTGARTHAGGQIPSTSSIQGQPHHHHQQDEISDDEARILEAILMAKPGRPEQEQGEYVEGEGNTGDEEYGRNVYEYEEEDERCPEQGEIFFEKSKQCVPRKCPTGTKRDQATGFCHADLAGVGHFGGRRPAYVYRGTSRFNRFVQRPRLMYPRFRG